MDACEKCPLRAARELAAQGGEFATMARAVLAFFPGGCPAWMDGEVEEGLWLTETPGDDPKAKQRIVKGCYYKIGFVQLAKVISVSNRPAAEISAMRGEQVRGLEAIGQRVEAGLSKNSRSLITGLAQVAQIMTMVPGVAESMKQIAEGREEGESDVPT